MNEDLFINFGYKLKYLRNKKKLSQMKLGEISGVNFNYISQIERGVGNPTLEIIKKLADTLEIKVVDLFDFKFD